MIIVIDVRWKEIIFSIPFGKISHMYLKSTPSSYQFIRTAI